MYSPVQHQQQQTTMDPNPNPMPVPQLYDDARTHVHIPSSDFMININESPSIDSLISMDSIPSLPQPEDDTSVSYDDGQDLNMELL